MKLLKSLSRINKQLTSQVYKANLLQQFAYGFKRNEKLFTPDSVNYTTEFKFLDQLENYKAFQVMDFQGNVLNKSFDNVPKETLVKIFNTMIKTDEYDAILYMMQRQGKISFYMPSFGEVATTVTTGAALEDQDLVFPQYREQGCLIYRGFTIHDMLNQCIGNSKDNGKGRQMPVHYTSSKFNHVSISSPLCTQVPQASGAGYAFRVQGQNRLAVTWFGEGAASEGDFHSAMNFAQTLKSQTLFLCRNNHYAISTPIADQFDGHGIVGRGLGYGMTSLRVDGNDALAVYNSIKKAREYIIQNKQPVFIEFISYRIGDHSTSDLSTLYRTEQEVESWKTKNCPIKRLGAYLKKYHNIEFNEKQERIKYRNEVISALKEAEKVKYWSPKHLFEDVYDQVPSHLKEQNDELQAHLAKYPDSYKLEKFLKDDE